MCVVMSDECVDKTNETRRRIRRRNQIYLTNGTYQLNILQNINLIFFPLFFIIQMLHNQNFTMIGIYHNSGRFVCAFNRFEFLFIYKH